ncbi:hypothetical protein FOXB_16438 [Fusarium oxysporum f. sp. conglutinans Fo5176]|uniref:Uncharacterized protein n=1 Tax=Fusarium oxysporum (strain Fo5176) TaxID=660025 RepID=F9GCQ5_FUSOF|nr:hypothetical protein FOXB_16438 [Fusarium oxysporum f. sp. conglutinans Fo5176]
METMRSSTMKICSTAEEITLPELRQNERVLGVKGSDSDPVPHKRAKLNRLSPADRDRMIAMRAAPEGFDNVQALRSSNGAVHGIDVPMSSSKTSIMQLYALRMLTPLSPDTRRYKTSELASLLTMEPGLGAMSYGPAGSMTSPSLELSFSPGPSDQSTYDSLPESQELTAHLNNTKGIGLSSSYIDPALIDPINSSLGLPI